MMPEAMLFDTLREAMMVALRLSAPMLAVALTLGLAIGLLQALTSVQEATLTFVPKMAAILAVFWVSMSTMTTLLLDFFSGRILPAVAGG